MYTKSFSIEYVCGFSYSVKILIWLTTSKGENTKSEIYLFSMEMHQKK